MKRARKSLAILLTGLILITSWPFAAFADELPVFLFGYHGDNAALRKYAQT